MKIGRYILLIVIILLFGFYNKINIWWQIIINKWDNYSKFYNQLGRWDRFTLKIYNKLHQETGTSIYPWVYNFTWSYSYKSFKSIITTPPPKNLAKITILEWWSIYDIDNMLSKKWIITKWDYIDYVQDAKNISDLESTYKFLPNNLTTLEWYLYPDTYMIDISKDNKIRQIVKLQLDNFQDKVWDNYSTLFSKVNTHLKSDWYDFELSPYTIIKLASIIENEEKNDENKPTIWGIFLNRIQNNMQLDADITLCYGLKLTYDKCTPSVIVDNLKDSSNLYNTRAKAWLPPTPISSPTLSSILAVLQYNKTDNLFYLHSPSWKIYYGRSIEEHNANKAKYLK